MYKVFFMKINGFEYTKKFGGVMGCIMMGGPAKFKRFPTFNLWLDLKKKLHKNHFNWYNNFEGVYM